MDEQVDRAALVSRACGANVLFKISRDVDCSKVNWRKVIDIWKISDHIFHIYKSEKKIIFLFMNYDLCIVKFIWGDHLKLI